MNARTWIIAGALATAFGLGLILGLKGPLIGPVGRDLAAQGALKTALETRAAAAPGTLDAVHIGMTFRDRAGAFCRTFQTEDGFAGAACRTDGRWRVRLLVREPLSPADYRLAVKGTPLLLGAVSAMMAGEPLNAADEAAALKRGWT